eukprot:TRINITY_DN13145_c0_g1_i1.p1 TRINITY_DN13145_c0_g1~~TRINITY_DN13145_c0_g1_i1.p1  ORF type:complete len:355 (-),score=21.47 TRINITY_DN13145_c0_g1_i1:31-1095(-)
MTALSLRDVFFALLVAVAVQSVTYFVLLDLRTLITGEMTRVDRRLEVMETGVARMSQRLEVMEVDLAQIKSDFHHDSTLVRSVAPFLVKFRVSPSGHTGNNYACGTIARLADSSKVFVLTSAHVIIPNRSIWTNGSCLRSFEVLGARNQSLEVLAVHMMDPGQLDLALLEILAPSWLDLAKIPMVSRSPLFSLQHLAGLCMRERATVPVHGRVMEIDETEPYVVQTDMGGTHGYSGCGYFANHEIMCVHQGQGQFDHTSLEDELNQKHLDQSSATSYRLKDEYSSYSTFTNRLGETFRRSVSEKALPQDHDNFLASLADVMSLVSRNPRTRCVPAQLAYNLSSQPHITTEKCLT